MNDEITRRAYHEAGHAVVAITAENVGFRINKITLNGPNGFAFAEVQTPDFEALAPEVAKTAYAMLRLFYLAAYEAEVRVSSDAHEALRAAADDIANLSVILLITTPVIDDVGKRIEFLRDGIIATLDDAKQFVDEHWDEIDDLVAALMAAPNQTLSGADAKTAVGKDV